MKGYWSQKTFPGLPSRLSCFFSQTPMATAKRIWKKVYSICNICNQFHWKHIMAMYLQMLRYYLEYWCRRYKDTHKVIFTKTIINKYVFFGTAVLAAIFYVHSVQLFSVMYIYVYQNSIVYDNVQSYSWIWCGVSVCSVHILWAQEAVEITIENVKAHKKFIVSLLFGDMCDANLKLICFLYGDTFFVHDIFYLHAVRIPVLTCQSFLPELV